MNLRGAVIPIIDLAAQLGLTGTEISERSVVVVAAIGKKVMGLLVGTVSEILSVSHEAIRPNPTSGRDGSANQVVGLISVNETMLRLWDLESLLTDIGPVVAIPV